MPDLARQVIEAAIAQKQQRQQPTPSPDLPTAPGKRFMKPDSIPREGAAIATTMTRLGRTEEGRELLANEVNQTIEKRCKEVAAGDLSMLEEMLIGSAHTVQTLSNRLLERAALTNNRDTEIEYIRLALASQNQLVKTLKALGELKNPKRATFIKQQLNQLNLQEAPTSAQMDSRGAIEAGPGYPQMGTLAQKHRAKDRAG